MFAIWSKNMKLLLLSVILLVSLFPVMGNAQSVQDSSIVPFRISSIGTAFAMQGEFEGEYRILPDHIEVNVAKAVIRISNHCPYKGERILDAISFGLATDTTNKRWVIVATSEKSYVARIMSPGDEYTLTSLKFSIPKKELDLTKHRLVVQLDDNIPNEPQVKGTAYAHSRHDIFSKPTL
jgi:hypothetical protein